jgi:hypothetical protein
MEEKASDKGWVYVVICEPERDANMLGLYDKEKEINFIPAFETKDAANDCFLSLPKEKGKKYEIQAVHIEELHKDATDNGFVIAIVDSEGNVIKDSAE